MTLTELQVRKAKPQSKPYKLSGGGGFFLLVSPTGGNPPKKESDLSKKSLDCILN